MDRELHLILLWSKAFNALAPIREDIDKNFRLVGNYSITWDKTLFAHNLTRFYGQLLPKDSFKEQHCGNGPFTLFLVIDEHPHYALRSTSHGISLVNTNLFDAKDRYRKLTGGGHKVHTTNTPAECAHDIYLLLGESYRNILQKYDAGNAVVPATPTSMQRNLSGHDGWNSLEHFFEGLNECLNYVVLRNFEHLPSGMSSDLHGDIDFLVDNLFDAVSVMNADNAGAYKEARHFVTIAGRRVPVDLHQVGDNTFCQAWAEDILHSRIRNGNGIYIPCAEHAYSTLSYHVFFQKHAIAPDYPHKLDEAARCIGNQTRQSFSLEDHWKNLRSFMVCHEYTAVRPAEKKLPWDERFTFRTETVTRELQQAGITDIRLHDAATAKQNLLARKQVYFKGRDAGGKYVFIKWNGIATLLEHEFFMLQKCHVVAPTHFPKPVFCAGGKYPFLVTEFLESQATPALTDKIATDLCEIADALRVCNIVHRNISPESIVCTHSSTYLVDFKWAFDRDRDLLPERDMIRLSNPGALHDKLCQYSPKPRMWDDAHALYHVACSFLHVPPSGLKELRGRIGKCRLTLETPCPKSAS